MRSLARTFVTVVALAAGLATVPTASSGSLQARADLPVVRIFPDARVLRADAGPASPLTPAQIRIAYHLGPLLARGITGAGQTIVIVDSFGSPTITQDLAAFDRHFGLPAPQSLRIIQPAGRVPGYGQGRPGWAGETTLDVEWAHVMAPGAGLVLAETPTAENEGTTGFPQIVTAETYVLRHHLGQVISQSFGATEQTFPARTALVRLRKAYRLAAADHVTVLAATGDEGATSYTYSMRTLYTTRSVSWPATDPLVTAIGGTLLDLRADGSRRSQDAAWSNSGGGRSVYFTRPSYQSDVRHVTGFRRGIPDVSMDAACGSPVAVYATFPGSGPSHWSAVCGTSLATPLFAGLVALADQRAGRPLGLLNPALYRMPAAHDRGIVDVRTGNNTARFTQRGTSYTVRGFAAGSGYDLVSGIGTVNAAYFVPELARLATARRRAAGLGTLGEPSWAGWLSALTGMNGSHESRCSAMNHGICPE
jgi:subtilase family serine protease